MDEGLGSGSRGDGQAQPVHRRNGYGQRLGPPPEVRVPTAPFRKSPLIRKRFAPAVNAVEHDCYGNACSDDVRESPRQDEDVQGDSAAFSAHSASGQLAMADSLPLVAKEEEV